MLPIHVKLCKACNDTFETVNTRDKLCPNCRLDRQLDRINNQYRRKKICAARNAVARS